MTLLTKDLERLNKASDFIKKLNSEAFKIFVSQKLSLLNKDPVIYQTRHPFPRTPQGVAPISKNVVSLHYGSKSQKLRTHLDYLAAYPKEADFSSTDLYHDGVLVGGAISALAQEFLLGIPASSLNLTYAFYSRSTTQKETTDDEISLVEGALAYHIKQEFKAEGCNFKHLYEPERSSSVKWESLLAKSELNSEAICFHPITREITYLADFLQFLLDEKREVKILKRESSITPGTLAKAKLSAQELQANFYLGDAVRNIITSELSDPSEGWGILKNILEEEPVKLYSIHAGKTIDNNQLKASEFALLEANPDILLPYFQYDLKSESLITNINFPLVNYLRVLTKKSSWLLAKKNRTLNWYCLREVLKHINPQYPTQEVEEKYYHRLLILMNGFEHFYKAELKNPYNKIYLVSNERNYSQIERVAAAIKADLKEDTFFSLLDKIQGHSKLFAAMMCFLQEGWTFAQTNLFLRNLVNLGLTEIGAFESFISTQWASMISFEGGKNHGLLCNFSKNYTKPILFKNHTPESLLAIFKEVMEEWHEINREKNTLRPTLPLGPFKSKVKEITLATDLENEGKRMSHCVGGYSEKVRSRHCRIFHLEHKGEKATLEVLMRSPSDPGELGLGDILLLAQRMDREYYINGSKEKKRPKQLPPFYRISQLKSFANSEPSSTIKSLANLFINYLSLYQKSELPVNRKEKK